MCLRILGLSGFISLLPVVLLIFKNYSKFHFVKKVMFTGAPNDRILPNTPEMSQMVFSVLQKPVWLIWSLALKTIYLLGCLGGSLVVTKVLNGFFVSYESVSYPYGSGWKFKDNLSSLSQALEISGQYLLLRTVILQKKVAACPCRSRGIVWIIALKGFVDRLRNYNLLTKTT